MKDSKGLLESKTVWGALLVMVAPLINKYLGVHIDATLQAEIADYLTDAAQIIGAGLAIYGRVKATKRIGGDKIAPLALIAFLPILSSCAGVSENDCLRRVLSAERAVTQSYSTASSALASDMIDADTAKKALKITDAANAAVDHARNLCPVDVRKAGDYLSEAGSLLIEFNQIIGE